MCLLFLWMQHKISFNLFPDISSVVVTQVWMIQDYFCGFSSLIYLDHLV